MEKSFWPTVAVSLACLGVWPVPARALINGGDSRKDPSAAMDPTLRGMARSTVAILDSERLTDSGDGQVKLSSTSFLYAFAEKMVGNHLVFVRAGLCESEPFYGQPSAASCAGFLVGKDLVATAGHCEKLGLEHCKKQRFVFGFGIFDQGQDPTVLAKAEVYGCREIVSQHWDPQGADYALIRLDREVLNHPPLAIDRSGMLAKDDPIAAIGCPMGLSVKIGGWGRVLDISNQDYFTTSLDAYPGNSGSPVIDLKTYRVVGIHVRGDRPVFVWNEEKTCLESKRVSAEVPIQLSATRISKLSDSIPLLPESSPGFVSARLNLPGSMGGILPALGLGESGQAGW